MAAGTAERTRTDTAARSRTRRDSRFSFEARMLTPALVVLAALSLFPFVYIIVMSLSRVGLIGGISFQWAGLDNWTRLFSDSAVGASWLRSIVYFVLTVGLELVLGIAIALCVHELVWGKNIALSLILMPMFMAPVIVGLLGRFLTDSTYGLYAWVLKETGLYTGDILGSTKAAFAAVTLMDVWQWTPLIALIVLAGLASMPGQVLEAAKVDGATWWQRLFRVILPNMKAAIMVAVLFRALDAYRIFDNIFVMTAGAQKTESISFLTYRQTIEQFQLGMGSALSVLLFLSVLLVAFLIIKLFRVDLAQARQER
jgi:multiple sugar transport system permease protein